MQVGCFVLADAEERMRLRKYICKFSRCDVAITIIGLCEEYREGIEQLRTEPWYQKNEKRKIDYVDIHSRVDQQKCPEVVIVLKDK